MTNLSTGITPAPAYSRGSAVTGVPVSALHPLDLFQLAFDLCALTLAWHLTFQARLAINPWMSLQFSDQDLRRAAPSLLGLLALWCATSLWLVISGRSSRESGEALNMFRLSESTLLVTTIATLATWVSEGMGAVVSRSFMVLFGPISYCLLILARSAQHWTWLRLVNKWPALVERVAVVGAGEEVHAAAERIGKTECGVVQLVGVILPHGARTKPRGTPPVLGATSQLAELINVNRLQRLLILNGSMDAAEFERCSQIARRMGVVLSREVTDPLAGFRVYLQNRFGMCLLDLRPVGFTRTADVLKRAIDLVVSMSLIVLLLPLMTVAAMLIRLTSPGPVLYRAPRVGRGGRHFTFLKFRTMYHDPEGRRRVAPANERGGHIFKIRRDPRITPVGRIMRRYSIDELPQLFNILLGDMSLLGPRPLPAEDLDPDGMSRRHPAWAELRALVKPGLTGLWQVRGRSDLPFEQMISLDLEYIENWSLMLDLKILLATPLVVITGRGAY